MTTDPTYTLAAYLPSTERHDGCYCHGTTIHYDSDFQMERGLTFEQLALKIATIRTTKIDGFGTYDIKYFDDTAGPNWEYDLPWGFDDKLEALIAQQQPILRQRQEQEAAAKAALAAEQARIQREKAAAEEKERREREEYQRLKTKFAKETA